MTYFGCLCSLKTSIYLLTSDISVLSSRFPQDRNIINANIKHIIENGNYDKNSKDFGRINIENSIDITTAGENISNIRNIPINI